MNLEILFFGDVRVFHSCVGDCLDQSSEEEEKREVVRTDVDGGVLL